MEKGRQGKLREKSCVGKIMLLVPSCVQVSCSLDKPFFVAVPEHPVLPPVELPTSFGCSASMSLAVHSSSCHAASCRSLISRLDP